MDDVPIEPSDETLAALALIDATQWVEVSLKSGTEVALAGAEVGDPEIALVALLKLAERLALLAGEYEADADEFPRDAALRLLAQLRQEFGRSGCR